MSSAAHRSIDIRQLRYFLVVAEELNFRRAAERLHLTQPPLSRQIAALEQALGVALLDRRGTGTRLTPAGEQARAAFAQAVQAFDDALARAAAPAVGQLPSLRLGLPWWMDMSAFASLDAAWRDATGLMPLEPLLDAGPELLAGLLRQSLDVALLAMPADLQGLQHLPVASLQHVAVVPTGSPLARKRALRLAELQDGPAFLRFARRVNPALWHHYQRQYDALGFKPAREADAPGTSATIAQIAAGRGCTLLPTVLARQRYPGVAYRRLLDPVTVDLHLVLRQGLPDTLVKALSQHHTLFGAAFG
jgi:DNA-binding transcriptional LysR family regulator